MEFAVDVTDYMNAAKGSFRSYSKPNWEAVRSVQTSNEDDNDDDMASSMADDTSAAGAGFWDLEQDSPSATAPGSSPAVHLNLSKTILESLKKSWRK